ncbi:(2Fe-2S)-binding protein [Anaeromyxobacter terrae]|uniref:(2Fe-2S)-binding protein n=1 Tax=Anaeromyxobacter terrae TaxID=2925406 RepID=UPI001F55F3B7|nr:(2Fe-2S)-binding protein [Anaeromyxobacter sp. SG22]
MIVCICRAVSDRAIRSARDAGAGSVEAIGAATGAGTCCGCCRGTIARILAEPRAGVPCVVAPSRDEAEHLGAGLEVDARADAPSEAVPLRAAADQLKTP